MDVGHGILYYECRMKGYSKSNAVIVPNPKFTVHNDPTRFKSIHCYIHPDALLCH
jgi:hypothetical protein